MIFGVLLARKRYKLAKYLCVLLIVIGVSLFLYKDGKHSPTKSHFDFGVGELLLVSNVFCYGIGHQNVTRMVGCFQLGTLWAYVKLAVDEH